MSFKPPSSLIVESYINIFPDYSTSFTNLNVFDKFFITISIFKSFYFKTNLIKDLPNLRRAILVLQFLANGILPSEDGCVTHGQNHVDIPIGSFGKEKKILD